VLLATNPIAAEAFAPRAPTMAESIYCITIVVICVRMAGRLSRQTSRIRGRSAWKFCVRMAFPFLQKSGAVAARRCCLRV